MDRIKKEHAELKKQNAQFLAMLKGLEWCIGDELFDNVFCPKCRRDEQRGHINNCPLGQLLKENEKCSIKTNS